MQENQSQEDLIRILMESYATEIEADAGKDTTFANTLTSKLEKVLKEKLPYATGSQTEKTQSEQPDYNSILGPVLADGQRYSTAQILDMRVDNFEDLHKKHYQEAHGSVHSSGIMSSFLHKVAGYAHRSDPSKAPSWLEVTVKDIIKIPKMEVLKISQVGEQKFNLVNQYLQDTYGISLGTKLG